MSLIDRRSRAATVKARTELALVVLKHERFQKLLIKRPRAANNIGSGIAQLLKNSLRNTTQKFTEKMLLLC